MIFDGATFSLGGVGPTCGGFVLSSEYLPNSGQDRAAPCFRDLDLTVGSWGFSRFHPLDSVAFNLVLYSNLRGRGDLVPNTNSGAAVRVEGLPMTRLTHAYTVNQPPSNVNIT